MAVVDPTPANVRRAAELLRAGRLVAFPTETVYGLGADALSAAAALRIFEAKGRPHFDPLIVHLATASALGRVCHADVRARRLAEAFWPGPLTLVLPKTSSVPDVVTSGLPSVAVRVPSHPVALALLAEVDRPIAAPSANPFGYLSPTLAEHVEAQLGTLVDLVLDGGPCDVGVESTIIDLSSPQATLLRAGAADVEQIESIVGTLAAPSADERPRAPGRLDHHYSPRTKLVLLEGRVEVAPTSGRAGLLRFADDGPVPAGFAAVEVLSRSGDLKEAAKNLFAALHRLDRCGLDEIIAEAVPRVGVGVAVSDRLERAAKR